MIVHLISFAATHPTPGQGILNPPKGTGVQRGADLANHMHLTELHDDIMRVRDQLDRLHSDQVYYNSRCAQRSVPSSRVIKKWYKNSG